MHNASTKQRMAALRRKLGIFTGWQPRWVRQRAKRLAAQRAAEDAAAAAEAPTEVVAASTRAELGTELASSPTRAETETELASAPTRHETETELASAPTRAETSAAAETETEAVSPSTARETPLSPWQREEERARERGLESREGDARTSPVLASAPIPPAPTAPARRRSGRTAAAVALAAAVLAVLAVLGLRSPADPAARQPDPDGAARASERDARAAVALASTPSAAVPAPVTGLDGSTLEVRRGDTLWHLASVHLGDPMRWPELHAANASQIGDPDLIFPGQRLRVPAGGGAPL